MNGDFIEALRQIEKEKEIPFATLLRTLEVALGKAYKRHYGVSNDVNIKIDASKSSKTRFFVEKQVVEEVTNDHAEMTPATARKMDADDTLGGLVPVELSMENFGRIAAQTARQVMMQEFRETERVKVYDEYNARIGEVATGIVQRREGENVFINIGKLEALLPAQEQVRSEPYRFNDRIKVYLLEVRRSTRGPQVIVSRSHPSLIRRLFELEVPEIADGTVAIKSVAREPGARSKIAVAASDGNGNVDPVGACVGHRGARVQAVVSELYDEKVDIVRWSADIKQFVAESLSPAKSVKVQVNEEKQSCFVLVPDSMLSLAIGKSGQNVRLAARLTGWRIDIRSEAQEAKAAFARAAEEVEAEERALTTGADETAQDGALVLPTDESGEAVAYGDEVMITADMLKMLDDEDEE